MFLFRDEVRIALKGSILIGVTSSSFYVQFLALIEEAVTTSMTDLAPMFGVKMGEVYITASPNYITIVPSTAWSSSFRCSLSGYGYCRVMILVLALCSFFLD